LETAPIQPGLAAAHLAGPATPGPGFILTARSVTARDRRTAPVTACGPRVGASFRAAAKRDRCDAAKARPDRARGGPTGLIGLLIAPSARERRERR